MDTNEKKILYKDLSYKTIGLTMQVYNKLSYGFLEKGYESTLMGLIQKEGLEL